MKWKFVNTEKYDILSKSNFTFILNNTQQEEAERLIKEYGDLEFCFSHNALGISVKVRILKTNEIINLSEYD